MVITSAQLRAAVGFTQSTAIIWTPHLNEAMGLARIVTVNEVATFLAQLAHESANFTRLVENLNYSAEGLAKTWPKRYGGPNALARKLHRRPTAIANNCYANRMGNGDEASGDGWRYRGRGPIMITGKNNYRLCGVGIGVDLLKYPERLSYPREGALSAAWYWINRGLDAIDHDEDIAPESRIINGGTIGLAARERLFDDILKVLKS